MLNDALFVNYEGRAVGRTPFRVQYSIERRNLAFEIAQQGIGDFQVFRITLVCISAVDADSQHRSSDILEFGDISLIRLQFLRSTARESKNVESQHDVVFLAKIGELRLVALVVRKREVRGLVAHL